MAVTCVDVGWLLSSVLDLNIGREMKQKIILAKDTFRLSVLFSSFLIVSYYNLHKFLFRNYFKMEQMEFNIYLLNIYLHIKKILKRKKERKKNLKRKININNFKN